MRLTHMFFSFILVLVFSVFLASQSFSIFGGPLHTNGGVGLYTSINGTIELVVDDETLIPGETDSFGSIGESIVLPGGDIAFYSASRLSDNSSLRGIYIYDGTTVSIAVDTNTEVPGFVVGIFREFSAIESLGNGDIGFTGFGPNGIGQYIYRNNGTVELVGDERTTPPTNTTGSIFLLPQFAGIGQPVSLGNGNLVFKASIGIDTINTFPGIWTYIDGVLDVVVDTETRVPGATTAGEFFAGFLGEPISLGNNDVAFKGSSNSGTQGIYSMVGGVLEVVMDSNDPAPGGGTFSFINVPINIGNGDLVFNATLSSGERGLYGVIGGNLVALIDSSTPSPDGLGNFDGAALVLPMGNGDFLFRASLAGGEVGLYSYIGGVISLIVNTQTPIPSGSGNFTSFGHLNFLSTGNGADAIFHGFGHDGSVFTSGIYTSIGGVLQEAFDPDGDTPNGEAYFSDFVNIASLGGSDFVFRSNIHKDLVLFPLDPGLAGVENTISSAPASFLDGEVAYIYSMSNGALSAADSICPGFETTLVNPNVLTTVQADIDGFTSFSFNMPAFMDGVTVFLQAVDIESCLGSNVNQEFVGPAPTVIPPTAPTLLAMSPGTAGGLNTISATGATPNSNVRFIYGFNQQTVTANKICPGFQSGIINPRTLPIVQSDGAGNANLNVNVPANLAGVNVLLQAADIATCTGSNVNQETL